MNIVLRAPVVAFGAMIASVDIDAQTPQRPPIFAPAADHPAPTPAPSTSSSLVSERVRAMVTSASAQVLANVKTFDAPPTESDQPEASVLAVGSTVRMSPYLVKSTAIPRAAVYRPVLPSFISAAIDRIDRRLIEGVSTNQLRIGENTEINLNLMRAGGAGIDSGRDFIRAEIEFKIRF
jgi:hypothetical protein